MKKSNRITGKTRNSIVAKESTEKMIDDDDDVTKKNVESNHPNEDDDDDISEDDDDDVDDVKETPKNANERMKRNKMNKIDTIKATKHREASVIYIGHLPALFGEYELLSLLKQFGGTVTHVRISRSEKTGNSRGYAFIRILESDVADIIVNTLSGYLLFSQKAIGTHKRFVCHIVPPEKVHPRLFVKHTCAIAMSKARKQKKLIQATQSKPLSKVSAVSEKLVQQEQKKRKKIKDAGFDYDFPGYEKKGQKPSETSESSQTATPLSSKTKHKSMENVESQKIENTSITTTNVEKDPSSKKKRKSEPPMLGLRSNNADASKAALPLPSSSSKQKKKNRHSN